MCQGCVDDGKLSQETFDKIEAFLEKWEWAEFGPAHIVIGDDNVDDHNLDFSMVLIRAVLAHRESPSHIPTWVSDHDAELLHDLDWYENQDTDELEATLAFLQELRAIPEDER